MGATLGDWAAAGLLPDRVADVELRSEVSYEKWLGEMSLPMGRGTGRVRSCGLMRRRDGAMLIVAERGAGRQISACCIDAFLSRDGRSEPLRWGMGPPVWSYESAPQRPFSSACQGPYEGRESFSEPCSSPVGRTTVTRSYYGQERCQSTPSPLTTAIGWAHRRCQMARRVGASAHVDTAERVRQTGADEIAYRVRGPVDLVASAHVGSSYTAGDVKHRTLHGK